MPEPIERRVHDNVAETNGQRKEHLRAGGVPHLRIQQLIELWRQKVQDAICRAGQRDGPHEQHAHDQVRKEGEKVRRLAGALDAAQQRQRDAYPGEGQAQHQLPVGQANAVVDVGLLFQHHLAI